MTRSLSTRSYGAPTSKKSQIDAQNPSRSVTDQRQRSSYDAKSRPRSSRSQFR
jgi:hypothetical protein